MAKKQTFTSKKLFRALCSPHIWRYGYINPASSYMGKPDLASLVVPKKGGYVIDNLNTIGICSFKKDKKGKVIYSGDILKNNNGQYFEVRYGKYAMYCPVDDCMMENVGFYTVATGYYEDMPLGPTEEYATIVGNIHDNPDLKVGDKFRCPAKLN